MQEKGLNIRLPDDLVHELQMLADVKGVDLASELQNAVVEYLRREAGVKPSVVDLYTLPPYLRRTVMALLKVAGGGTLKDITRETGRQEDVELEALRRLEAMRYVQEDHEAPETRYQLTVSRGTIGLLDELAQKYGVGR